jgi:hypothetical protein
MEERVKTDLKKKGKQAEPSGYPFNKQKSKIQNSKLFVD